jgi:hypothetical protein
MTKQSLLWIGVFLGVMLIGRTIPAAAVNRAVGALEHTNAVVLVIDGVDEELAAHGLSGEALRRTLASDLQAAGVAVVDEAALVADDRTGELRLRVRLMRAPYYFYLYNVNLTLNSKVGLAGGDAFTTLPTWSDGWVGALMPTDVARINDFAKELLSRFIAQRIP